MSILTASNLSLSFGALDLFRRVTVTVPTDGKIGLIGPNGVGKTSLLLLLTGVHAPTTGEVHLARGRRLGYLRQEAVEAFANRSNTVYAEMLIVFADLQERQARLHALEAEMANGNVSDALLETYGSLQEAFDRAGGYDYEVRIQQTLTGLGLGREAWDMPLNHLSGGQKTRALLARLLLEKPDLLMLDEPTNHLDIEAVEWLERTLRDWDGAVLIVSHDRFFLDNTVNTIWEMKPDGIDVYSGNYSAYLLQRQERWEYYERVFKEEKARLLKEADFIQRNWIRASTHARALGRLRLLTRDLAIVDAYGILALRDGRSWSEMDLGAQRPLDVIEAIRKVNAIRMPSGRPRRIRPRLPAAPPSGTFVLRINALTVGYPGNPLFKARKVELRRGERVALVGPNGSGKTTFLKVLLEQLAPLEGEIRMGASLKVGYFAQAHDGLNGEHSLLDELLRHKDMQPAQARNYLASYLFTGDDIFKPVRALSGGERARLALAILALDGANLLLLDEPTNHLDIPAREALQEVLENFTGTILMVTHDRFLIDQLATRIWEICAERLEIFDGSYRQYVLRKASQASSARDRQLLLSPKPLTRDNSRETRRREQSLDQVEARVRQQETTLKRLSAELQKAGSSQFERVQELGWQVARAQARLEELMHEWEALAE
ncbi:MAG: ABC-F family ATP-binding cassette domain-containing protein [Anaerolineales bacterium]|nr:ABC-F family ATP-binding cassette domain-containing protein [Anaerolineales bacterium]